MGEAIILRQGGRFYPEEYTAGPQDVLENEKFMGYGSDQLQDGKMKILDIQEVLLEVNGTYNIAAGYHPEPQIVKQKKQIPTQGGMTITPVGNGQIVDINGKYMTGDVVLEKVDGYDPVNIKRGVTIGEGNQAITGNYEGFN